MRHSECGPGQILIYPRTATLRAAVSVMSNIAEGFERSGHAELARFLSVTRASAGEVQSQLYISLDQGYMRPEQFEQGDKLCDETMRLFGGFVAYLKR